MRRVLNLFNLLALAVIVVGGVYLLATPSEVSGSTARAAREHPACCVSGGCCTSPRCCVKNGVCYDTCPF